MSKGKKCFSLLTDKIPGGFIALIVLFVSVHMVITGLNDPDKYVELGPALEIAIGGMLIFFSVLYFAYLFIQIAEDCEENKRIASFSSNMTIALIVLDVIAVIFISVRYYLFAIGFAFLLFLMFLYFTPLYRSR
jgi:hypothetical protein